MKYITFLFFLFLFYVHSIVAQENPFLKMAGKKYADYSQDFIDEAIAITNRNDTVEFRKFVSQIREVAEKTGSIEWKMQTEYYELSLIKLYMLQGKVKYSDEEMLQMMSDLLKKVQKEGVVHLELKLRYDIIEGYWFVIKNYELALEQCEIQNKRLQTVSSDDIPEIAGLYLQIANIYYTFADYSKAISYLKKIVSEKETTANQWDKQHARNTMGLCYRYGFNDLDRSDSCFQAILQAKEYLNPYHASGRELWEGIAEGNIGRNKVLRGEYDAAIPLLKSSLTKVLKFGDYGYLSHPATNLAIVYIAKGNLTEAKRYIDSARHYYDKAQIKETNLYLIYEAMSKYYAAAGNTKLCIAYMDSTLAAKDRKAEQFNAMQLTRVEQRKHLSEQKLQEAKLREEEIKSTGYLRSLAITMVGLFLLGSGFIRYIRLYRKKKSAYQELVRKLQEWADVKTENLEPELVPENEKQEIQEISLKKTDTTVMKEIERLLSEEKMYTDTSFTLDSLAQKLNTKRYKVSEAINHSKNKNFTSFINEYRVKEAIQLLSKMDDKLFSIDYIALNSGFSDRVSFYRVFKKITGLSPTEFKKNMGR